MHGNRRENRDVRVWQWTLLALTVGAFHVGASWPEVVPDQMLESIGRRARVASSGMVSEQVRATTFGLDGGVAKFLGRHIKPGDICIAHRELRGGSTAWVSYRGTRIEATVCDRGPMGCDLEPGQMPAPGQRRWTDRGPWLCTRPQDVGTYRSDVDLSEGLADRLGFPGRGTVWLEWQERWFKRRL